MNQLYFGDNLAILKQFCAKHPDGFIDLVYIDPPFNSKRNYNVLFETVDLHDAKAQKEAFADTWSNVSYKDTLNELSRVDLDLYNFLNALDHVRVSQHAVSYLTTMAIRIYYIHKALKPTGSFYLHCDPTMSHYLKIVCDLVFGEKNFRAEISWRRTKAHNDAKQGRKTFEGVRDIIFYYTQSDEKKWNQIYTPYGEDYLETSYNLVEKETGRRYKSSDLTAAKGGGDTAYEWKGFKLKSGRFWAYSKSNMEKFEKEGRLYYTSSGLPRLKHYLDEMPGKTLQNDWDDIKLPNNDERLGYPTQKPVALLERIIQASSNEGDLVADFFCGCGTTVAAAQKLNRNWIGVDISHLAIGLIRKRLIELCGEKITKTFTIDGLPEDIGSAKALAVQPQGRMHFQDWVIETLIGGVSNEKKVGDGGYDGYTTLEVEKGKKEIILIEVKSGNIGVTNLRSFATTIKQQNAGAGILVCFREQITKGMLSEAKGQGYFREDIFGNRFDKIQIISVEDLLDGKLPQLPRSTETGPFKKAGKAETKKKGNGLFD